MRGLRAHLIEGTGFSECLTTHEGATGMGTKLGREVRPGWNVEEAQRALRLIETGIAFESMRGDSEAVTPKDREKDVMVAAFLRYAILLDETDG